MTTRRLVIAAVVLVAAAAVGWWLLRPAPAVTATRPPMEQGAVLLVPGYGGGTSEIDRLADALNAEGLRTRTLDVGDGTGDLQEYAEQLRQEARAAVAAGEPAPDVIGFSAGGVVARIAATADPDGFRRVVTLASPHAGTAAAELGALFAECPTACQQLRPDSPLLQSLPEPRYPTDWLSVWSDSDPVIRPPVSSVIDGVSDYRLQQACGTPVDHGDVANHPQTLAVVVAFLRGDQLPGRCVLG